MRSSDSSKDDGRRGSARWSRGASCSSAAKLDDGSGWPGFWAPFYGALAETEDGTAAASHVAVRCSRCDGHLGTLSRDAPTPTGLHHRIDGLAIRFTPAAARGAAAS